jgi:translation initiation factor IF-1
MFSGPDSESPAALWKHAGREPATSDEKVAQVKADEGRPLHARLTGSIRIKILHGDQVMTSASLQDLELVRRAPDSPGWYLPEKEVQRAKRAAGF